MHGISVHSALAIKRQRKRREQYVKKYKSKHKRRQESQIEEGPEDAEDTSPTTKENVGTVTSFHIGLIFIFISILLLLSALITFFNQQSSGEVDWKEVTELFGTFVICLVIGLFLLLIHRIYSKNEDEHLNNYINRRLCKSKSGNIIYKEHSKDTVHNIEV